MAASADKFYRARIVERRDIADGLWVIRADPGGEYQFVPGQYATLGVATPEKHHERAYSIVAAPHEKVLEFFIELVPQGEVTPKLYPYRVGDEFTLRKAAKGRFTLDTRSSRENHLLLATVTGVAPFVSYVRSLYYQRKDSESTSRDNLFLIDGASRSLELGYREELEQIAANVSWFTYVPTVSRPWEDISWKGEEGRVEDLVRKYADSWGLEPENTVAYLCGHASMIENVKGILKRRGWQRDAVKEEAFFIPAKGVNASDIFDANQPETVHQLR
jgi:ferredoxin/flavodoxin---NADP+ reductase